jgi:hypothetical protein
VDQIDVGGAVLACLADVHGNTAALDAVLGSEEFARASAVAFLGCTTTGPDPLGVLERCADLKIPVFHLAGNGERLVLEFASGVRPVKREVDEFLVAAHGDAGLATIGSWPGGLRAIHRPAGGLRMCRGSPRSDVELLTTLTGDDRLRAATAGVDEAVVIHGHSPEAKTADAEKLVFSNEPPARTACGLPGCLAGRPHACCGEPQTGERADHADECPDVMAVHAARLAE